MTRYHRKRYSLHRVLPMRFLDRIERRLQKEYRRTNSAWSKRWLDRLAWFTTPYRGARMDSSYMDGLDTLTEIRHYRLHHWDTTNVRWEMYRVDGDPRYRAIGLTGGTHGRGE